MFRISSIQKLTIVTLLVVFSFFSEAGAFEAKTSDENLVRVDVKPIQLAVGKPVILEVRLNTHSVDLINDMAEVCTLQDNQGKLYKVSRWKGSSPGGHHRRGILEFPQLEGTPQSVRLVIQGIAGVPERSFEWKIEG